MFEAAKVIFGLLAKVAGPAMTRSASFDPLTGRFRLREFFGFEVTGGFAAAAELTDCSLSLMILSTS